MFKLSNRSRELLRSVDPALRRVVERAIQLSEVDFGVTAGGRTLDEQRRLFGRGRSARELAARGVPTEYARPEVGKVTWTLNSKHLVNEHGLASAVDLAPFVNSKLNWDNDGRLGLWPKIAKAMKDAAELEGVAITWGGDWARTPDRPHFELTR